MTETDCLPTALAHQWPRAMQLAERTTQVMPLPCYPDMDYDDYVSEAYLGALEALRTYDASRGYALESWIIQVVRWRLLAARRQSDPCSQHRRERYYREFYDWQENRRAEPPDPVPERPVSLESLVPPQWANEGYDPVDPLAMPWLAQNFNPDPLLARWAIQGALAALEPGLAGVVRRRLKGETLGEIALALGCSDTMIDQRLTLALTQIKAALDPEPEGPVQITGRGRPTRLRDLGEESAPRRYAVAAAIREGLTPGEIAAKLSMRRATVHSLTSAARACGLLPALPAGPRGPDPEPVLTLYLAGKVYREIEAETGYTRNQISHIVQGARKRGEIPARPRFGNPAGGTPP
jgi:RNA polymerase sigma factor (sigma-70 family)